MWSYLGAKTKIANLYDPPHYDTIIEPFAGSARYSLLYWKNEVLLYDANPMIVDLWNFLINASPGDIVSLPDVPSRVSLDEFPSLTEVEKTLIGFHLCRGKAKPRAKGFNQNSWHRDKHRIAANLYKIRHWKVTLADYTEIPNRECTHFIDPPYELTQERPGNSDRYPRGVTNYAELAAFSRSRLGQVIVCEGEGAEWLPFRPLIKTRTNTNNRAVKHTTEMIWTNQ